METHISRQFTLAELEPGWPEDMAVKRTKSSPRTQGSMRMALRKVSRTPENSRLYTHGDPVNLIDWKAYGRSDELIIREHRDEASARVLIVFDIGATLRWPTKADLDFHGGIERAVPKSELAVRLLLYFAHAHLTCGDSVTVSCTDGGEPVLKSWSPKSPADVIRVHEVCLKQGFTEGLLSFMVNSELAAARFDIGCLMTDFLGDYFLDDGLNHQELIKTPDSNLMTKISRLVEARDLRVFHIFSWLETVTDWMDGATSYRDDLISSKIYLGDQLKQKDTWSEEINRWKNLVSLTVKDIGGSYLAVNDRMKVSDLFHWLQLEAAAK
jgi:hypothetical protein